MRKPIILLIAAMFVISAATVLGDHTATVDLQPEWSPAGENVDYSMQICNQAGSDTIKEIRMFRNPEYSSFDCKELDGWVLALEYPNYPFTPYGVPTDMCFYFANTTDDPEAVIEGGECETFEFSATVPDEGCSMVWYIESTDEFGSQGDWYTWSDTTSVDDEPPQIIKSVAGPQYGPCPPGAGEECWITSDSTITAHVNDVIEGAECDPPSGVDYCDIVELLDEDPYDSYTIVDNELGDLDDAEGAMEMEFSWPEDSKHTLNITCYDVAGNMVEDVEVFRVDNTEPETEKTMSEPKKIIPGDDPEEYIEWADTETIITLDMDDPEAAETPEGVDCSVGVDKTWYRNDVIYGIETAGLAVASVAPSFDVCYDPDEYCNAGYLAMDTPYDEEDEPGCIDNCQMMCSGDLDRGTPEWYNCVENCAHESCDVSPEWKLYNGSHIQKDEESCHVLQYFSVDHLGNAEDMQFNCFFVDKTPPLMDKETGEPKKPLCSERDYSEELLMDENEDAPEVKVSKTTDCEMVVWDFEIENPGCEWGHTEFGLVIGFSEDKAEWQVGTGQNFGAGSPPIYQPCDGDMSGTYGCWDGTPASHDIPEGIVIENPDGSGEPGYGDRKFHVEIPMEYLNNGDFYWALSVDAWNAGCTSDEGNQQYPLDWSRWSGAGTYAFGGFLDWWVKSTTDIDFTCLDPEPHPSGDEELCFKVSYDEDPDGYNTDEYCTKYDGDWEGDWCCVEVEGDNMFKFNFNEDEDSFHDLEYFCRDAVEKSTEPHIQYYKVDDTAPTITKTMIGDDHIAEVGTCPPTSPEDVCYVRDDGLNGVSITVEDGGPICAVDDVKCKYALTWEATEMECTTAGGEDWSDGICLLESGEFSDSKEILFHEDSMHELAIKCVDALGNEVEDIETFYVDSTPPETTKSYGDPMKVDPVCWESCMGCCAGNETCAMECAHEDCTIWINTETEVTLEPWDEKVGTETTYYRNLWFPDNPEICDMTMDYCNPDYYSAYMEGDPAFVEYTEPFTKDEDSCHVIEYYSVDRLGNEEIPKWQCVYVDDKAPIGQKTVGDPNIFVEGGDCDTVYNGEVPTGSGATIEPDMLTVPGVVDPGYTFDEHKVVTTDEVPIGKLDVMFLFDLTGSMSGELSSAKTSAVDIMTDIRASIADSNFGVGSFMDYNDYYDYCSYANTYGSGSDYPWSLDEDITSSTSDVDDAINALTLGFGSDGPESYSRALYESQFASWRDGARKVVVIFQDNDPHDCDWSTFDCGDYGTGVDPGRDGTAGTSDDLPWADVVQDLKDAGISVVVVNSGGSTDCPWQYVADETGGILSDLGSTGTLPEEIVALIEDITSSVGTLTLEPKPGFEDWVEWSPVSYSDVEGGDVVEFDLNFTVPADAPGGDYHFYVKVMGDGSIMAVQEITVTVSGEPEDCEDSFWWVRDHVTPITLECTDQEPHPVEQETVCYRVSFDDPATPWLTEQYCDENGGVMTGEGDDEWCCAYVGDEPYEFVFVEDSLHDLEFYCKDHLGNAEEEVDLEYFRVDSVPPEITKVMNGPYHGDCPPEEEGDVCYVDTATSITVETEDGGPICAVGGVECQWRYNVNGGDWSDWSTEMPITFPEESNHELQIECEDALGNKATDTEMFIVDKQAPYIEKTYEGPLFPKTIIEELEPFVYGTKGWGGDMFNFTAPWDCEGDTYFGWDAVQITKRHLENCDLEMTIEVPEGLEQGSQENFWFEVDSDNDGEADWQFSFHSNQPDHYPGSYWSFREKDGSWGPHVALPEWIEAQNIDWKTFKVTIDSDKLGNDNGMADDCGLSYGFAGWIVEGDEGFPQGACDPGNSWPGEAVIVPVQPDDGYFIVEELMSQNPHWINTETVINVEAVDPQPHPSGVADVEYRVTLVPDAYCNGSMACEEAEGDGSWTDYSEGFSIGEESCHLIEIVATDNVEKSRTHKQCVFVDNTPPTPVKTVKEPSEKWYPAEGEPLFYPEIVDLCWNDPEDPDLECWKVTMATPIDMNCEDLGPHPVNNEEVCFRVEVDADVETERYCELYEVNGAEYDKYGDGYCCVPSVVESFYFTETTEHNLEYYCVDALGNSNRDDTDDEKFKVEETAFNISLNKKWNLISVPVQLLDDSIEAVFDQCAEEVISVWTYNAHSKNWTVYSPDGDDTNDNLDTLKVGDGYWVLADQPCELTIGGSLMRAGASVPPSKPIVGDDWNLVGYYGAEGQTGYYGPAGAGQTAHCVFQSLGDDIWDFEFTSLWSYWQPYSSPWLPFSRYQNMDPGAGYWVYATEDGNYVPPTACLGDGLGPIVVR